jgi:hypothetical protein
MLVKLRTHEGYARLGVQMTVFEDWHAVAKWCGGLLTETSAGHGLLVLPSGESADLDDWVVQLGASGCFVAWTPNDAELLYVPAA